MKEVIFLKEAVGKIKDGSDIFKKIKKIKLDFEQENFLVFFLNNQNKIISTEILFKGSINSCLVSSFVIFKKALLNNCNKIIIAHNHPSGDLNPSEEDAQVFEDLKEAGKLLEIKVLDSIIFNKKEFYTLRWKKLKFIKRC